jgi:hypothetical protein
MESNLKKFIFILNNQLNLVLEFTVNNSVISIAAVQTLDQGFLVGRQFRFQLLIFLIYQI